MAGISLLDTLKGLRLTNRRAAETALRACQTMLSETGEDCVCLVFGSHDEVTVGKNETIESLEVKFDAMRKTGHDTIDGYRRDGHRY